jgi:hypothetical protein
MMALLMSAWGVRRDKATLSSGCEPHPATAPAGSNRSSHGGNEVAEAIPLYLGLFMQNGVQQRIVNFYLSIVANESQFAEFVHEEAHPGSGRSNHLCQCFLTDIH